MTAFVLVPGAHTGGWVWEEVAGRLRESGAQAYPVTLTGMGGTAGAAAPEADLETHVQDLLRLVDRLTEPEVVLVGHCYGIHPVLGAADRRRERIARVVHLDTGIPRDGERPLELVPDQEFRDRLRHRAGAGDGTGSVPPPSPGEWSRWGSTTGVPEDTLARLARLAVAQPAGTFTRPLRLSGAIGGPPATGVLCTANGSSIAAVEAMVDWGDSRFDALTDPRAGLFELNTGHWPMLSAPDELATVLLRAAAGEGHRVAATGGEGPAHLRPFLLDVPQRRRERTGRVDLHLPDSDRARPAIVFVHGGPLPPEIRPSPRDWPAFTGYGQYAATLGAVGVTVDHRLHDLGGYGRAAGDIADAVEQARADPRVDGERVALWFFSGGGLLSADWLADPPPWLRCVALTYPVLAPLPGWGLSGSRFHPAGAVRSAPPSAGRLPIVLTRVERERPEIAVTVEEFLTAARHRGTDVELVDVPQGRHGFETVDHGEPARRAVDRAMRAVLGHLRG